MLSLLAEPFPPISFVPAVSPEVGKVNNSEFLDFKCRLGQLENNTLAMYNVSWFRSKPAVHLKTEVIDGNVPRDIRATLHELRALGFRLGDTVSFQILKDKFGVDKIIVEKQPYELLNTNREYFPNLMP